VDARFLSHLDLLSTWEYALRRARLPVARSAGFNPRPKISLAAPLPTGYLAEEELLELELDDPVLDEEIGSRLQAVLPAGITLQAVSTLPENVRSAASRVTTAEYRVDLRDSVPDLGRRVEGLLACQVLEFDDGREGRTRRRDLRPLLLSLRALSPSGLEMSVRLSEGGTIRPEHIVQLLGLSSDGSTVIRLRIGLDAERPSGMLDARGEEVDQ
jgi:radical SAM-linked protein